MSELRPPLIETERLLLTWPTPEQVDGFYHSIIGTNIFDTLLWDGPSGVQELHDWWAQSASCDPLDYRLNLNTAVIERTSGRYIGGASLCPVERDPQMVDLGFAFAVDSHGKGYATEALGALVDEAFGQRGAERVFGKAFVGNDGSRRVMEKLGFVCEGTLRRCVFKQGTWIDEWLLAITRPDWEARQAGLSEGASVRK
ncbi:MAG: GNAT family protein [Myxococcota bacterium]|nr:GNAT family protein [Myxococcota bacterium]